MAAQLLQQEYNVSSIELSFSCTRLKNLDTLSKSDPMVVVFEKNDKNQWLEIGRTEMIKDNLNPSFVKKIKVDYHFEAMQNFRIAVYDVDAKASDPLSKHDFIGSTETTLHNILGKKGQTLNASLMSKSSKHGNISIVAEEVRDNGFVFTFQFSARGLPKMDFFGGADPYFVISRVREDGTWIPIHRSEVIKKNRSPTWKPCKLPFQVLSNCDWDRPLRFEVFDWDRGDKADKIGEFTTSCADLVGTPNNTARTKFQITDKSKRGKKAQRGEFNVLSVSTESTNSFIDYLSGGLELSLLLSVDFTASNGTPTSPNSLHYRNPVGNPNDYEQAISSVTSILLNYDADQQVPAFGFGAKLPPDWAVNHCFPLNGNSQNPCVSGTQGCLDAYRAAIANTKLSGPTIFTPSINQVVQLAKMSKQNGTPSYYTLLILTDGLISDWDNTVDAIIAGSELPMSIIIVGIGNCEQAWERMEELDADDQPLSAYGKTAKRDIVQFVSFNAIKNRSFSAQSSNFGPLLTKEVLAELPGQVVGFMKSQGIKPRPPPELIATTPTATSTSQS